MFDNAIANLVGMVHNKHFKGTSDNSVCDLGNQTYMNTVMQRKIIRGKTVNSTKEWYAELGFTEYLAIDVNTKLDAVALDLNYVLKDRYGFEQEFDVVTNNGTGEHIFNQLSVFQNMHNLCKVGGFMLHVLPFQKHCDHGFYNFQPNLFAALAEQNDYVLDRSFISNAMWTHNTPTKFTVNRQKSLADDCDAYNWGKWDPEVLVAMRKTSDKPFEIPFQGLYKKDIAEKNIEINYK
jgi:SAM-dependent methyltransferase